MEFPLIYFPDIEIAQRVLKMANPNGGSLYVDSFCLSASFVLIDLVQGIYIESYADEFYITQEEFDGAKIKYH